MPIMKEDRALRHFGWVDPATKPVGYYVQPGGEHGLSHDVIVYAVKDHPQNPDQLHAQVVFMPTSNMAEVALQPCMHDKVWVLIERRWFVEKEIEVVLWTKGANK